MAQSLSFSSSSGLVHIRLRDFSTSGGVGGILLQKVKPAEQSSLAESKSGAGALQTSFAHKGRVARCFRAQHTKTGKILFKRPQNIPSGSQMYQMDVKS
jgi:hypothetical protein